MHIAFEVKTVSGGLEGLALPSGIMLHTHLSDAWSLLEWPGEKVLQSAQTNFTGK